MLKQRVITAVVLLALLLPAMVARDARWFEALTLLMMAAGAWEWSRLQGCSAWLARSSGVFLGLLLMAARWRGFSEAEVATGAALAAALWGLGVLWLLRRGLTHWRALPLPLRLGVGWLAIALAWLALVQLKAQGLNLLLSVLTLVWAADIAAYFGGRAFGRRKLAPQISPGKTWAGAISGVLAVAVLGYAWILVDTRWPSDSPSIHSVLWQRSPLWWLWGGAVLVAFSVLGDLVESLVKRVAGVKDSSQLLPGHGGVLDRVDALLPVLPLSVGLMLW